jgi:hypothetical protein
MIVSTDHISKKRVRLTHAIPSSLIYLLLLHLIVPTEDRIMVQALPLLRDGTLLLCGPSWRTLVRKFEVCICIFTCCVSDWTLWWGGRVLVGAPVDFVVRTGFALIFGRGSEVFEAEGCGALVGFRFAGGAGVLGDVFAVAEGEVVVFLVEDLRRRVLADCEGHREAVMLMYLLAFW